MFAEALAGTEKLNLSVLTIFILERKKGALGYTALNLGYATCLKELKSFLNKAVMGKIPFHIK